MTESNRQASTSDTGPRNERPQGKGPLARLLGVVNLRPGEALPALLSTLFFFCILCGYMFIRPVREAFGVERGMDQLRSLFIATMLVSLAINPLFSWLVGRFDRRVFLPISYGAIVLMLVGFAAFRSSTEGEAGVWTGRVFFVWLSVANLFMTGLFWALMADTFSPAQSRRLFPLVAVGGTVGAVLGSAGAWAVSGWPFEVFGYELFEIDLQLSAPQMMLISAGFVALAALLSVAVSLLTPSAPRPTERRSSFAEAVDGVRLAARSPYLMAIGGYIGLLAVAATFLYFAQGRLVLAAEESEAGRVGAFASIDLWTQLATLLLQLALTARLIRLIGLGLTLTILPAVVLIGFGVLAYGENAAWGAGAMLAAITIVQAVFRASKYAVARPAREALFTVLSRDEKYKAKSLIDTFVYRLGDAAGAGVDKALASKAFAGAAAASMTALAATAAPAAIIMAGLALWLGSQQNKKAQTEDNAKQQGDPDDRSAEPVPS